MESGGNDSPPLRSTILGSFLGRGRPRNSSQSHIDVQHHLQLQIPRELSPSPPTASNAPASPAVPMHANNNSYNRRRNGPPPGGLSLGHMLRRRRSAGNVNGNARVPPTPVQAQPVMPTPQVQAHSRAATAPIPPAPAPAAATGAAGGTGTHRIRLVPHLDSRRSLRFDPIARDLKPGEPALRIGRFTDRSGLGLAAVNALSTNKIAFKSKVVSRAHAEVWIEDASGGGGGGVRFLIRDTKSSSGTFLNHVRLSPANAESRPHPLKDGDILQLGVDYQGGAEDIYKSVKIRIEIGREWQSAANAFKCRCVYTAAGTRGSQTVPELGVSYRIDIAIGGGERTGQRACMQPVSVSGNVCERCRCMYRDGDEWPVRIRGLVAFTSRIVSYRVGGAGCWEEMGGIPAYWTSAGLGLTIGDIRVAYRIVSAAVGVQAQPVRVRVRVPCLTHQAGCWEEMGGIPAYSCFACVYVRRPWSYGQQGRARPGCFRHSFEWGGGLLVWSTRLLERAQSLFASFSFLRSRFLLCPILLFSSLLSSPLHLPLPFRFCGEISPHGLLRGPWGWLLVVHLALGFSWSSEPWRYGVAKLPNDEPGHNRLCYPRLILHTGLGSWRAEGASSNHPSSGLCFATPRATTAARRSPISQFDRLRELDSGP
ncbi:hypothetical protein B0H14DRAFT_3515771 [Mycena olivaceomarginata]|nr:hypothetical protein B0H14DRAFT_3515771 [Mycena olivaceomarginata]